MEESPTTQMEASRFLKYTFFKVAREWRSLSDEDRESARRSWRTSSRRAKTGTKLQLFSLVGIRGDADFMILADSKRPGAFPGAGLSRPRDRAREASGDPILLPRDDEAVALLALAQASRLEESRQGPPERAKYMFVYPFVKMRSWYGLPFAERQRIMGEHFKVGRRYPMDQDKHGLLLRARRPGVRARLRGRRPRRVLALVEELRSTESSEYTELETPIFTCVRTERLPSFSGLLG